MVAQARCPRRRRRIAEFTIRADIAQGPHSPRGARISDHTREPFDLFTAGLIFAANAGYAQEEESQTQRATRNCIMATGLADYGTSRGPAPEARNDLWNAIAFAPSRNLAAFAGSFTAPENAKAAALKAAQSTPRAAASSQRFMTSASPLHSNAKLEANIARPLVLKTGCRR
jgi:hypothetical protein